MPGVGTVPSAVSGIIAAVSDIIELMMSWPPLRRVRQSKISLVVSIICFHQTVADGSISDINNESIPVGAIDGDGEPHPVVILVKSYTEDFYDLDMTVGWQIEELCFSSVRASDPDRVAIASCSMPHSRRYPTVPSSISSGSWSRGAGSRSGRG